MLLRIMKIINMKERPILFSTPMVRAILDGRKTQTRRIIKCKKNIIDKQIGFTCFTPDGYFSVRGKHDDGKTCTYGESFFKLPYQKGMILWVRETWIDLQKTPVMGAGSEKYIGLKYWYRADNTREMEVAGNYKPSIFMPKEASRIKLEITNIRPEKLCDITEEDAMAEGISLPNYAEQAIKDIHYPDPSDIYAELWDEINGIGSWIKNPWVWVIEFIRIR